MKTLVIFLHVAALTSCAFSSPAKVFSCEDKPRLFTEFHTLGNLRGICTHGCFTSLEPVKGSQVYTDDSSICKSAIHAGVINNNGGLVEIVRLRGRANYLTTRHNGITSSISQSWTHSSSFKFVSTDCVRALGLRSNTLPDGNFRASSTASAWLFKRWRAHYARLDKGSVVNAWRPQRDSKNEWWEVDMGDVYDVRGIVTQGSSYATTPQYITEFKIKHRISPTQDWVYALDEKGSTKVFSGNYNENGRVTNNFVPSLTARYLRLVPVAYVHHVSLRAEILVCSL